ncbi:MAG TPA: ATP-binding protein [Thermoleophilaceae bacterium]|nr:ATP-binding protein [Thermoleophilaceae bacterium]
MVIQHVRRFIDDLQENLENGRGLWFYGDVGTGKTSLAMLVADRALKRGFSVAIYSIPRLFNELRGTYDDESRESFLGLFGKLCSVDLLILDDLGAERQTDWVLEQLYSIVNERWQNRRSIIVTSNIPTDKTSRITLRLGEEIDELHELGQRQGRARELTSVIARMEALKKELADLDRNPQHDPFEMMREQIGYRTISRLLEMCDDPIPIMGPDLRISSAG